MASMLYLQPRIPFSQVPQNVLARNNIPLHPLCPSRAIFQPQIPFPSPARTIPFEATPYAPHGLRRIIVPILEPCFPSQGESDPDQILILECDFDSDLDEEEFEVEFQLQSDQISCTIHTLPVNPKLVGDGDGMTVHVDMSYALEIRALPPEIHNMVTARLRAKAARDYETADYLQEMLSKAGYRMVKGPWKGEILAKEYRVRLKGIDAPEIGMAYGGEAKAALIKLIEGRSLQLDVYGQDAYGRLLADVYIGGQFIQEILLKEGHVWHYRFFDTRPELAQWQFEAQAYKKGLWADPNPQSPWDYKRQERSKKMMSKDAN